MSASATQGGNKNGLQKAQKYVEYQKNFMQRLLHVMVNGTEIKQAKSCGYPRVMLKQHQLITD